MAATGSSAHPRYSLAALRPWPLSTPRDRKSTRLNSSHSQISYAVFCLNKKKAILKQKGTITVLLITEQFDNLLMIVRKNRTNTHNSFKHHATRYFLALCRHRVRIRDRL